MTAEAARKKTVWRESFEAFLIAVIFVNFVRIFAFQAFKIPTGSMIDNLLVGDHIIVNKFAYGPHERGPITSLLPFREIERGDVVVFRYPEDPTVDFVKRVIGLPGETIDIRDKEVLVNGERLQEDYTVFLDPVVVPDKPMLPMRIRDQFGPERIPDGSYFVMGDNRDHSNDSRFWGPVPAGMIKGRAVMVYWSFEGEPTRSGASLGARLRELGSVGRHFFSRTRWERTFFVVDSEYHYQSDLNEGSRNE